MFTTQIPLSSASRAGALLSFLSVAILLCATASTARATSPCTIGLPGTGTAPVTLDGKLTTMAEWNDAGLLSSGPCLEMLSDGGGAMPRTVKVYSKRYTSAVSGLPVIGFLFEVPDATRSGPCGGGLGQLCLGERIALQFDSDRSRGPQLGGSSTANGLANDYQIVIAHKWGTSGTDNITDVTASVFERQATVPDCTNPEWVPASGEVFNPNWLRAQSVISSGAGYSVEIEVPLSFLGNPPSDIGFAFAIANDIGDTGLCGGLVCDSYAVSFPSGSALPVTNATNPFAPCHGNWVVPDEWGTGIFGLAPGMVSVSRSPDYSSNDGLLVYKCADRTTPNYTYFNNPPCQATLKANINNATSVSQSRNILFLWSPFGAATPSSYNFVEVVEHVTLPPSTITPVFTQVWNRVPHNQMAHPCVRVYILPDAYLAAFPRSSVVTISNGTQVAQMEAAYGLALGQWTQKNINEIPITTRPDCDAGCNSTGANDMRDLKRSDGRVEVAAATPADTPWQDGRRRTDADDRRLQLRFAPPNVLPPAVEGSTLAPQTKPDNNRPPIVSRPGRNILMSREEFELFSRNNVIVQVHAVGYGRARSNATLRYNFLENLGGVIEIIPVSVLQQSGSVPFQFNVTNGDTEHTIFLVVDIFVPPGVSQPQVALDTKRQDYAPNENRVARGFVILPGAGPAGAFKHWGLSLHAGVSIPHGNFGTLFKPGPNFAVDLEYRINKTLSLEGIYGWHHFPGETSNAIRVANLNLHQLSLNGRVYGSTFPWRPFLDFGGGAYKFGSGGSTRAGVNVGAGVQFDVKPTVAVEGVYNFHNVFRPGSNRTFSAVQAGVRFRF